jgi:DNA-binding NarL/FixJ family response regulator
MTYSDFPAWPTSAAPVASYAGAPVRVVVVDDHPMMRAGIAASLMAAGGIEVVAEAGDADAALAAFARTQPDVVLVDLVMPGKDGIDTIRAIRALCPDARLILLTTYGGDARLAAALKAGARAYVMKSASAPELVTVVREVHEGRYLLPPELRSEIDYHYSQEPPSAREVDVLRLVAHGRSNREIAAILSVTEATVKSHMSNVLRKLHADDRAHAIALAAQRGFIRI